MENVCVGNLSILASQRFERCIFVATPPPAPKKEEKKTEEKKEEKKEAKEALSQKGRDDDFWNPPCEWHLSEDGSECISR
jgi:hypothetical protein